jgi:hypothetical protein
MSRRSIIHLSPPTLQELDLAHPSGGLFFAHVEWFLNMMAHRIFQTATAAPAAVKNFFIVLSI